LTSTLRTSGDLITSGFEAVSFVLGHIDATVFAACCNHLIRAVVAEGISFARQGLFEAAFCYIGSAKNTPKMD